MLLRLLYSNAIFVLIICSANGLAQGGPPFVTDDPATPGNRHLEVNIGWTANHNPASAYYQLPDLDFNYGWGNRVQLKYQVPLVAATDEHNTTRLDLGQSQPGMKIRLYEHFRAGQPKSEGNMDFSVGTYPQASINNPTGAVRRGILETGPQYYLPLEVATRVGPVSLNGEVGRWIGNRHVPDRWGRGLIAGHEFSDRLELYAELYNLQDVNRIKGAPKQRTLTLGLGGRQTLDRTGYLRLLFMGGRSVQAVSRTNSQPNWIAYLGVQVVIGANEATEKQPTGMEAAGVATK